MTYKAIVEIIALIGLFFELRRQGLGRSGWWIVLMSALFGYEMVYKANFGMLACGVIAFFAVYAWRNWFVSLSASIILMAFLENRDAPHSFLGIQGMNPWNLLFFNVLCAWWTDRRRQGLSWDMPRQTVVLALCALFVVFWSYSRVANDYESLDVLNLPMLEDLGGSRANLPHYTFMWVTSEYLINCVKWVLPGILLYDGCRTRRRVMLALGVVLAEYFLIATQVVNHMRLAAVTATATQLAHMAARDLDHTVGYFRTEISMMLAGASWGILSLLSLARTRRYQILLIVAAAWVALGQALTGGRAGYVTWGLTGLVLCVLRWRKMLPLIPLIILAVCLFLPAVRDRMMMGFGGGESSGGGGVNMAVVTSGRYEAWAHVIPAIKEAPILGYGRQAMVRTGIYEKIMADADDPGETFPHPHNAYLELLLDDGLVGFFLMMPIYFVALIQSFRLLMDRSDPLFSAVGGVAGALILGLLFASMGSQSFYPKESSVAMWAAIGLMLRVYVERARSGQTGQPLFGEVESEEDAVELVEETAGGQVVSA